MCDESDDAGPGLKDGVVEEQGSVILQRLGELQGLAAKPGSYSIDYSKRLNDGTVLNTESSIWNLAWHRIYSAPQNTEYCP